LIVLTLFTALIAPYFIDWGSFEKDFERETSRIIGQNVEVTGETRVRLLPIPSVTFDGLSVGKNADNSPMMTVDQFAMDVELMPMLKGVVKIVKLNLVRPKVNLHVDASGAIAWTDRQKLLVDPEQIKLENFTITNGEINIYGLTGGRTLSLEQLDGRISAKSLYGPWRIGLDGYVGNKKAHIDFVTGHLQDDNSIRIKLTAKRADLPYRLSLDGPVQVRDGLLRWNGEYELDALSNDVSNANRYLPILAEGNFEATPHRVDVPQFRLEIGGRDDPYTITGNGYAIIREDINFKIKADGRQIDIDRIGKKNKSGRILKNLNLEQRLGVLRTIIEKIPVPTAKGVIDLTLPAIVAGDTFIRDVVARVSPQNNSWKIQHLGATLPGNTKFEASGKVGVKEDFGFSGKMLVASKQPTGLAKWLGKRNNPFIRKLHSAGFTADVVISNTQTSLDNLELVLDAAVLRGKIQRLAGKNSRPAAVIGLHGEHINLDDLRAIFSLVAEDDTKAITSHDLDISLKAGELTGFDISAQNVEARFRVFGGSISIEKLDASNFFGASLVSSGRIDNLLHRPNGQFNLAIKADNPTGLLGFINTRFPGNQYLENLTRFPVLAEELDLNFVINARSSIDNQFDGSKGQAFIRGEFGGTRVDVETVFRGKVDELGTFKLDINPTFENTDPARLLMQLNLPVLPVDIEGPLKITGTFSGDPRKGVDGYLSAQLADSKIKAEGKAFLYGDRAGDARFKITQSSQDIGPLMLLAGIGLPSVTFGADAIPYSFTGDVELNKNSIFLRDGDGQINGREFGLDLKLVQNATSNHRVTGNLTATSIDLPVLTGFAFASRASEMDGASKGWSEVNFGQSWLRGLDGEIKLNVGSSDFGLGDPANNIQGQLALVDGSINLNNIKGNWMGGNFDANLSLKNGGGIGSLSSQFRFTGIDLETISRALEMTEFVTGGVNIIGDLEGNGRSPAAIVASLTGSGTIDLDDIVISGLNTSPLNHVFAAADQEKFEILDENVLPIVIEVIDNGTVDVSRVSIPYIVAVGKLRARNISVDGKNTDMTGAIEVDIKESTLRSDLSVRFDAGKEWVEGADPQIIMSWNGDIKSPKRSIDVQPLSGFLSLRSFEREQRRVDKLQSTILEKQRLRRDIIVTNARVRYRQKLRNQELRRQRQAFLAKEEIMLHEFGAERHYRLLVLERLESEETKLKQQELKRIKQEKEASLIEAARIKKEVRQKEAARKTREARIQEQARLEKEGQERKKNRLQQAAKAELKSRRAVEALQKQNEEKAKVAARKEREIEEAERLRLLWQKEEARIIQQQLDADKQAVLDSKPKPRRVTKTKKPRRRIKRVRRPTHPLDRENDDR
jgi:uncharacterized protein involved in outer membrane biogenesis